MLEVMLGGDLPASAQFSLVGLQAKRERAPFLTWIPTEHHFQPIGRVQRHELSQHAKKGLKSSVQWVLVLGSVPYAFYCQRIKKIKIKVAVESEVGEGGI
jgi:hypothetical protein